MAPHVRSENPSASWMTPARLNDDDFSMKEGRIFLGRTKDGRDIGVDDNRHIVTIAGSRAGKSATSLMSNLLTWDGSAIIIDPKGELATNTATERAKMGQDVYILDPFGEVEGDARQYCKTYNPFEALREADPEDVVDEASIIAEALVTSDGRQADHWTLSAKNLLRGLCLYAHHISPDNASLVDVREILNAPMEEAKKGADDAKIALLSHFRSMMMDGDAFGGVLSGIGGSMFGKPKGERGSIVSTAIEQTSFLDSARMRGQVQENGLPSMRLLKRKPTTIYLVLPASRMSTHARWLRVILTQAMTALEQEKNVTARPVLFVLEEFPALGHVPLIESSAGLMAGYDVKLWTVMQDLSQLKAHYPRSWETFLGNAGVVEAFGNTDTTTLDYLSKRLGMSLAVQVQPEQSSLDTQKGGAQSERDTIVNVPLIAPYELALAFAREKQNKLVMIAGEQPFGLRRIFWKDIRDGG